VRDSATKGGHLSIISLYSGYSLILHPDNLLGERKPPSRHFFECALNRWIACARRALLGRSRFLSVHIRTQRHVGERARPGLPHSESWAIGEPRPTSALRAGFREPSWSHCHDCRTLRAPIWKTHRRTERFLRWLHFDSCCSANAHSRSGSRWPAFANSILSFATAVVAGHCDQQVRVCPRRLRMRRHIAISSGSND
jgi:hypothetical protein